MAVTLVADMTAVWMFCGGVWFEEIQWRYVLACFGINSTWHRPLIMGSEGSLGVVVG